MLPLFPLNLVAFPGEKLNLHIFEPRYRQLVKECLQSGSTFGIPPFLNGKLGTVGTEMRITELSHRYDDGRFDIKTVGIRAFQLDDFVNPVPDKLYAGGTVSWLADEGLDQDLPGLVERLKRLFTLLQLSLALMEPDGSPLSFRVGHKVGLSKEEEYALLQLTRETERQAYLIRHLERILPVVAEVERSKERIRQNGHFKNLDPLQF
jgi:Lon protease-like protein